MAKAVDRLAVVENISKNIENGKYNEKAEVGDPQLTEIERQKIIVHFDTLRKKPLNRIKANIARKMAEKITLDVNKDTEIVGIENIQNLTSGAIITCNHFSKIDNTIIRYLMCKIKKEKDLYIVVQETNMKMPGTIGFLLKNCYTIPLSMNTEYLSKNFEPTLKHIFDKKGYVLIYPEQEMWFNYKKPRAPRIGAYHYACKFNVPIVPCFIEMNETDDIGEDGFKKIKYKLHVLPAIYPDIQKEMHERKKEMCEKDYDEKVEVYEKVYNRKIDSKFEKELDIAGW